MIRWKNDERKLFTDFYFGKNKIPLLVSFYFYRIRNIGCSTSRFTIQQQIDELYPENDYF
jgi:hypothetical protein